VLTMYDARTNLAREVEAEVRRHFPNTFRAVIPRSVRLAEAPSHGEPINVFDPTSAGARAYDDLAAELIESMRSRDALPQLPVVVAAPGLPATVVTTPTAVSTIPVTTTSIVATTAPAIANGANGTHDPHGPHAQHDAHNQHDEHEQHDTEQTHGA